MKTIYYIMTFFFLTIQGFFGWSQTWPKYYSQVNMYDNPEDLLETYDKGYMICGNFGNNYGQTVKQWSWLIKTDINGNILWEKIINAQEEYVATYAIDQTMDGGILACGLIFSWNAGMYYPYVLKLNACGEKEWCKIFTGTVSLSTWAQDIKELPSGEIIVLVNQWEELDAVHLFKLNNAGEVLWINTYCHGNVFPQSDAPLGSSITLSHEKELLISGRVYWENPWGPAGVVFLRPLFVLIDTLGYEKWVLPFGLNDTIYGKAFNTITFDNNLYIGVGFSWPDNNLDEGLVIKIQNNGNVPVFNTINAMEIDTSYKRLFFYDIKKIDSVICLGGFIGPDILDIPTFEGITDTNLFNKMEFTHFFQDSTFKPSYSLNTTDDHKILSLSTIKQPNNYDIVFSKFKLNLEYDTAYHWSFTYDTLCLNGPPQSGIINLADCDIVVGIDAPTPEQYYESLKTIPVRAYPNPAGDRITFELENTRHHPNLQLICYDIFGKMLHSEIMITGQTGVSFDVSLWAPGVYITVIYSNGSPAGKCKFMVKNR